MDARKGQQLIEVVEPEDVADLGDEGRDDRRSDSRDGSESTSKFTIEKLAG